MLPKGVDIFGVDDQTCSSWLHFLFFQSNPQSYLFSSFFFCSSFCLDFPYPHTNSLLYREYWIIYRGPSFLAVVWFGSSPIPYTPLFRQQVVSLSQSSCMSPGEDTKGSGGGVGEEPNHTTARNPVSQGLQRDVVYLGWPIAPLYICPKSGGWGEISANEYSCPHGALINFGDLASYLT